MPFHSRDEVLVLIEKNNITVLQFFSSIIVRVSDYEAR